jgi:hypothetical protein
VRTYDLEKIRRAMAIIICLRSDCVEPATGVRKAIDDNETAGHLQPTLLIQN